jgi:hypothetical protein
MMIICIGRPPVDDAETIRRATRIERCPAVQTNVRWPMPVDQRLNELLARLADAGDGQTTRSRLLAALVAGAPTDPEELRAVLLAYGQLTAGKVVLQQSGPIERPVRRPGRRSS